MDTGLYYELGQKQLSFLLKQRITTDPNVQLRFRGVLNTATGGFDYKGTLQKLFGTEYKGQATQPLRIGLGAGISAANKDEPFLIATAKKKIALLEGDDTVLSAKAAVEFEPRGSKVGPGVCGGVSAVCQRGQAGCELGPTVC